MRNFEIACKVTVTKSMASIAQSHSVSVGKCYIFGSTKQMQHPGGNAFLFVLERDGAAVEKATNSGFGTVAFGFQTSDVEGPPSACTRLGEGP